MPNDTQIIDRLNSYIQRGIITYDQKENDSLLSHVWGLKRTQFQDMTWEEDKGRFLGGGVRETFGYKLTHNGQTFRTQNYTTSLQMFLNYVDLKLSGKPSCFTA